MKVQLNFLIGKKARTRIGAWGIGVGIGIRYQKFIVGVSLVVVAVVLIIEAAE